MPVFVMLVASVQFAVCRLLAACIHAWLRMCAMHAVHHTHVTSQRYASLTMCRMCSYQTGCRCVYVHPSKSFGVSASI